MKSLGRTGLVVSQVSLGTVALGLDYGIELPHEPRRPNEKDAIRLLQQAADEGINLFDTAPAYGDSERLIGLALGRSPKSYVATKVSIPVDADGKMIHGARLQEAIRTSLGNSLRNVGRDVLDVVQIHNATTEVIARGEIAEVLRKEISGGTVRFLGASVYGEEAALAAIKAGCFDTLQVAYNLLDQRMAWRVFPAASRVGVGIIVRSALLKGVLTERARFLPRELDRLRSASEQAMDRLAGTWGNLPGVALRFCLSANDVATVLIGATTIKELEMGLLAANYGPLTAEQLDKTSSLALTDEHLLNPSYWSI